MAFQGLMALNAIDGACKKNGLVMKMHALPVTRIH
jgi:hypothetical protein